MPTYSRANVETHFGSDRPAVNVKVYDDLSGGFRKFLRDEPDVSPRFTEEWVRGTFDDDYLSDVFWHVCAGEFEYAQGLAAEVLGVQESDVEQDGRMGGWLVVTGLPSIEEWDAIQLAKWRKFERMARSQADWIMVLVVESLYLNEWENREDVDDPGAESPVAELIGAGEES